MTRIDLRDVVVTHPDRRRPPILAGIDLTVLPGEFVALEGASGAGKTTLLACLAGLDRPSRGLVALDGVDLRSLSPRRLAALRSHGVGLVLQRDNVLSALSVAENVGLPARIRGRPLPDTQVLEALQAVGLADRAEARPAQLSGGERQRVAVARCLASRVPLILADEPTEALDRHGAGIVVDLLRHQAERGCTVVMVTHDADAAARAHRRVLLERGMIRSDRR